METEDASSVLVLILDLNPFVWPKQSTNVHTMLDHIFAFLNSYFMSNPANMLAIIGITPWQAHFLYPLPSAETISPPELLPSLSFSSLQETVLQQIRALSIPSSETDLQTVEQGALLSAGLSLSFCYLNRVQRERYGCSARVLCIQSSLDSSSQYISIMNCIFSAQKQSIPIDSCILSKIDSTFLQQAAHLTGGIYFRPSEPSALLQYLLSLFLADANLRKCLQLPLLSRVDYRASCFCHKTMIEMGYVCSVCLSIFCKMQPICSTCGTKFPLPKVMSAMPRSTLAPKPKAPAFSSSSTSSTSSSSSFSSSPSSSSSSSSSSSVPMNIKVEPVSLSLGGLANGNAHPVSVRAPGT